MMNALEAFAPTIDAERPTFRPDLMVQFKELNEIMGSKTLDKIEERYVSKP
jgi:hypothetical protein